MNTTKKLLKRILLHGMLLSLSMLLYIVPRAQFVTLSEYQGRVIDEKTGQPLAYANIYFKKHHSGVISNENGFFSLELEGVTATDTVCIQYIGYKPFKVPVSRIAEFPIIPMEEYIINLSETLIFGTAPDAAFIVKQVLINKDSNYRRVTALQQTFIRQRDINDFDQMELRYRKSDIEGLDEKLLDTLEQKIPKHTTSYTDFLGHVYLTANPDDSVKLKVDPERMVSLKEQDMDELEQYGKLFEDLLSNTGDKEYWKVRSGVFGDRVDVDNDSTETESGIDTTTDNSWSTSGYAGSIRYMRAYSNLNDKSAWDFLYHTGSYRYTLAGGTRVNGEDVYIIDFEPRRNGLYTGRVFISTTTYALIRADYAYAPGKVGRDIQLLGIGYTETGFSGSIFFEKSGDNYVLKYFSRRSTEHFSLDRSIVLVKKKKRWLFDKTLNEFKTNLLIGASMENSTEYLALDSKALTEDQFKAFQQPDRIEIIYVDQFDDRLWSGYPIIEPTEQMKEYKKQGDIFSR